MKFIAAAVVALVVAGNADATTLRFQFSGDASFTFTIDDHTVPNRYVNGAETDFYDVTGSFGSLEKADVYLFTDAGSGGIVLYDFDGGTGAFLDVTGPQLFDGSVDAPILLRGEFNLTGVSGGVYHLSVTPVPEPHTWGLMALGFGGLGWSLRRRSTASLSAVG